MRSYDARSALEAARAEAADPAGVARLDGRMRHERKRFLRLEKLTKRAGASLPRGRAAAVA